MVIRGERVLAVVARSDLPPSAANARFWDFPGGTLLPGLLDCHVHFFLPGDGTPFEKAISADCDTLFQRALDNARAALRSGITLVRDCGSPGSMGYALRRVLASEPAAGPRLLTCSFPITVPRGHTWQLGGEALGLAGLRRMLRQLVSEGADFVKVMNSGGGTQGTRPEQLCYSCEELLAVVTGAHTHGKRVAVHCIATSAIADAVSVQADTVEHAYFMQPSGCMATDPRVLDALAKAPSWVIPTLAVGRRDSATRRLESETGRPEYILDRKMSQFAELYRAGVKIAAGSDAGWRSMPPIGLLDEVESLAEAGLTNVDALRSATSCAAEALGLGDQVGVISASYAADLLVVLGNPMKDIGALRSPLWVMKEGAVVWEAERKSQMGFGRRQT